MLNIKHHICTQGATHAIKHTVLTVKMVGVTNAQQTFQKTFGWNPIIISISSQNLCKPAKRPMEIKHEVQWQGEVGQGTA